MTDAIEIAANYIATWNETDVDRRAELIGRHWSATPHYVDPLMTASGIEELSRLIEGVHGRFPGFRFSLKGTPDGHGNHVRFAWNLGPDGADSVIEGSDVIEMRDGLIDRVIGFLDRVPAG